MINYLSHWIQCFGYLSIVFDKNIFIIHGLGEHSGRYEDFAKNLTQKNIGVFFPAEKMRRRVYKEWVGDFWTERGGFPEGTKVGGYVAEKTIARMVPGLSEEYADEMFKLVKKVMKDK